MMRFDGKGCRFERRLPYFRRENIPLIPGRVSEEYFSVLIELSSVRSERMINALYAHLIMGVSRQVACERYDASISYFSICLGKLSHIQHLALQLCSYYEPAGTAPIK